MSLPVDSSTFTGEVRRTVLDNGLTVLTRELHASPIVTAMIWYRVGSRNEEFGQTGKSHFLEHMLFKGTDRFKKGEIDLLSGETKFTVWVQSPTYTNPGPKLHGRAFSDDFSQGLS